MNTMAGMPGSVRMLTGAVTLALVAGVSVVLGGGDLFGRPAAASVSVSASIVIPRDAMTRGYATKRVSISPGAALSVVNMDTVDHTVTSTAVDAGGRPLFDVQVPPGATVSIPAASRLASGSYPFYCRYHPNMQGTLTVSGTAGGVQPVTQKFEQPLLLPPVRRARRVNLTEH